jgi:hypothetical protein
MQQIWRAGYARAKIYEREEVIELDFESLAVGIHALFDELVFLTLIEINSATFPLI